VIPIVGVTREPDEVEETPHRHMFSVRFRVTSVSPAAIIGDVSGRTEAVISTSAVKMTNTSISLRQPVGGGGARVAPCYRLYESSPTRCRIAGFSRSTATRSARRPCTPWSSPRSSSSSSLVR
jgi:hypothetical protein